MPICFHTFEVRLIGTTRFVEFTPFVCVMNNNLFPSALTERFQQPMLTFVVHCPTLNICPNPPGPVPPALALCQFGLNRNTMLPVVTSRLAWWLVSTSRYFRLAGLALSTWRAWFVLLKVMF